MSNWFVLPGMGATAAMYNSLNRELKFKVNFIDWPEYNGEKSYADIAHRVIKENGISNGDVVGGSSLGGIVALEIAQIIKPSAVVLIGSAVSPKEVQPLLALLSPLASMTPLSSIQTLAGKHKNLVSTLFAESNPDFIRAMCTYLRSWKGHTGPSEAIFRIHGKKDHIIRCPKSGCDVIEQGGHLIAITHVAETASLVEKTRMVLETTP